MKESVIARHAGLWLASAVLAMTALASCDKFPEEKDPVVSVELLETGDTYVEFSVTAENAEYFICTFSGADIETREYKIEDDSYEFREEGLTAGAGYTISATAWNGGLSSEDSETFTTVVPPSVKIGSPSPGYVGVTFTLASDGATGFRWAVAETGTEPADADWNEVGEVADGAAEVSAEGLRSGTSYTISACAMNGSVSGEVATAEFTTEGLHFNEEYVCTVELLKMDADNIGPFASFMLSSGNCIKGRYCNVTAEEFETEYDGVLEKLVSLELSDEQIDQQMLVGSRTYVYGLENGTDYVLAVLPMGGDMGTEYGAPVMLEYSFAIDVEEK